MRRDFVYALRSLRKNAGFSAVATVTIALGIGACTAIFSVVNAVLLRPLPYTDASRLMIVWGELRARNVHDWPFAPPDFRDMRQQSTNVFEDFAGLTDAGRAPIGDSSGEPEQIRVAGATPNLFRVLGARIVAGRDFVDDDATPQPQPPPAGAPPPAAAPPPLPAIAIISHSFWMRRYGGDPSVVGRVIDFGNGRAQIVGVLAPDFELLFPPRANMDRADMWTALRINYDTANRNNVVFRVVGRLKPGMSYERGSAQVEQVAADLRKQFPLKETSGLHFRAVPMFEDIVSGVRPAILSLMGAVAFVLLIACANVANLLIVRASARGRELAIRAAIGGSRMQLVRQMLTESLVIAIGGTLLGVLLARWGISALAMLGPKDLPRLDAIAIDPAVLSFAVAAGMLTAVLCGIVPALRASRTDVMEVLRQSGGRASGLRGGRRLRSGVVIAEVALSFVLLIGAGLMVRSFIALGRMDPGFDPENVLTFVAQAPLPQAAQREAFKQQLRERLLRIPGVVAATAAGPLPLDGGVSSGRWGTAAALSDPASYRQATFHIITPGYFEALRTRIIAGRGFTAADNHVDPVTSMPKQIVIDSLLAARAFPNQSAVGQRLLARIITPEAEWFEVIGVVEHQRHISLADDGPEAIYFADGYVGHGGAGRWAVRTTGDPLQSWTAIRAAIAEVNPRTVTAEVQPMRAFVDKAMAPLRFTMTLVGVFAGIAAALAAIGLYGVLATIVRQRTAEIGMRLVFGAPRASILKLVVGEGMKLSAIGMATGIVAALALTRVMASLVVGVSPVDPATFAGIAALFAVVALAAAWAPAYRASRLDPMTAIREE